jgi:hypothetical protein
MSAVVYCGKRSSSIFADELLPPSPSSHHHHSGGGPAAKRSRFSPPPHHRRDALLGQLRAAFPAMDPQVTTNVPHLLLLVPGFAAPCLHKNSILAF